MKYRDLLAKLKRFGVAEYPARGKGSERLWIRETVSGSRQGPQYTMKCHGENQDVKPATQGALLRRLGIDPKNIVD